MDVNKSLIWEIYPFIQQIFFDHLSGTMVGYLEMIREAPSDLEERSAVRKNV